MMPAYLLVMQREEPPRTPTRKIQKNALPERVDLERAWRAPERGSGDRVPPAEQVDR